MANSQIKVWNVTEATTLRVKGTNKTGCGRSSRLYVGRIGTFDFHSYLKASIDWTNVGRIIAAYLVCYADDFLGENLAPADSDKPTVHLRRLTSKFSSGNNVDGVFDSSDWTAAATTTAGSGSKVGTREANGLNRFEITGLVNAWAPSGVKRSDGSTGSAAPNHGLALLRYDQSASRRMSLWSENATDPSVRPFIELHYEYGGTTPNAPINLTPSGAVASIGQFEGDFADIRTTDQLRRSRVQVYGPANAFTGEADTNVLTDTAHGLKNGSIIYFTALTGGTGLSTFTAYYVKSVTANTFKVAPTLNGIEINFTTDVTAGTWRTIVYDKWQVESNAAITAYRFSHIPENLNLVRNVNYAWRCAVQDQEGKISPWTSLVTVQITNTNPTAPTLTPAGSTYASLDGVQFRGSYTDPDGDRMLAYQVQLSAYAMGAPEWDDPTNFLWDTGKRIVPIESELFETPYGGEALDTGSYTWRARVWDDKQGVSNWTYATITLTADFIDPTNESTNVIGRRVRVPWRILIKEMKFNAVGGNVTGNAGTDLLTTATAHGFASGRRVRFSALTGGTGLLVGSDYYVIADGLTATAFKVSETKNGPVFDFSSNVTAGTVTAITTRGPGNVVAVIEDAHNVGASMLYNSPGELHFTLGIAHPQLPVVEPRQTHYAVEFRQGDGWREVFAGLMMDFDASDTDVIFYGTDYLGLLDFTIDENYDPANIDKASENGGSKYVNRSIAYIVTDQLSRARSVSNSPVGFISTGAIATEMTAQLTVWSTYQPTLPFITSLLDSHRAGTGKRTRLSVNKTQAGGYEFVVVDDPGIERNNLRLRYGEMVQGYRIVPFGKSWATRVNAIGRDKNGVKVRYATAAATGIDETVWGRWANAQFIDGVADANDMLRRTRQAVTAASKLGRQVALGLRSGILQPRDGYDLLDQFPLDVEHGSVSTDAFGSGYWVAVGITWQALQRGDLNTTLTLQPREDAEFPDDDLLSPVQITPNSEWRIGWESPNSTGWQALWKAMDRGYLMDDGHLMDEPRISSERIFVDITTGKVYEQQDDGTWIVVQAPDPPQPVRDVIVTSRLVTTSAGVSVVNLNVTIDP